jgi:5-methylcytosine-specific restriction endonuclease McrA
MKILPPVTRPWRERITRRHTPRTVQGSKGFQSYRPCLRWEFGFSCAFCLSHEVDLARCGVEGSGLTHVDHFIPQSHDPTRRNDYDNCFYACRFCNVARADKPNRDDEGRSLLEPCTQSWLGAFVLLRDKMLPRQEGDGDATYTLEAYELNEPRKVRTRRLRRLTIRQCIRFLERVRTLSSDLLDRAAVDGGPECVEVSWALDDASRRARDDLLEYWPIPNDRNTSCSCGHAAHHRLPMVLAEQLIDLSYLLRTQERGGGNGHGDSRPN